MKSIRQMPGYYRDPEKYSWWLIRTKTGVRRTVAMSKSGARTKAIENGYSVVSISFLRHLDK